MRRRRYRNRKKSVAKKRGVRVGRTESEREEACAFPQGQRGKGTQEGNTRPHVGGNFWEVKNPKKKRKKKRREAKRIVLPKLTKHNLAAPVDQNLQKHRQCGSYAPRATFRKLPKQRLTFPQPNSGETVWIVRPFQITITQLREGRRGSEGGVIY